jgi:TrmH family RNA methyltransferase
MKHITAFSNPIIKGVRALADKAERKKTGQFLLEGLQAIGMAFERGIMPELLLVAETFKHPLLTQVIKAMDARNIITTTPAILEKISARDNAQTVLAVYKQRWLPLADVPLKGTKGGTWVVLDNIKDPGNLGTIMRTADAVGAAGIILVGETCDPYSVECVRATMGSVFALPVVKCPVADFARWREGWQGQVVATALDGAVDYRQPKYKSPLLLLMGNEQKGLSPALAALATHTVKLPMRGGAESLNVAVATGIMLYQLYEV